MCDDIDDLLGATPDEYGVVWLDYMRTSVSVAVQSSQLRVGAHGRAHPLAAWSSRLATATFATSSARRHPRSPGGTVIQTATYPRTVQD